MDDLNTQYFQMTPKIHISVVHSSGSKKQRRTIYFILHTCKDTPGWGPQLGGRGRMCRYNTENQWERQAGKRCDYCAFFKGRKDGYSPCPYSTEKDSLEQDQSLTEGPDAKTPEFQKVGWVIVRTTRCPNLCPLSPCSLQKVLDWVIKILPL